jgi:hypothetical protein
MPVKSRGAAAGLQGSEHRNQRIDGHYALVTGLADPLQHFIAIHHLPVVLISQSKRQECGGCPSMLGWHSSQVHAMGLTRKPTFASSPHSGVIAKSPPVAVINSTYLVKHDTIGKQIDSIVKQNPYPGCLHHHGNSLGFLFS